jgi:glycosyltransferase involved in cell wall biosynthesis
LRILVIHQYYLMPGQPGGSRFNEFARLWAEAGHVVSVIAGALNYATNDVPKAYRGHWVVREQDGPVEVFRCHVPQTYGKSFNGRMWAFFGFTLSASTVALKAGRPDVVIATSPPLVVLMPGWLAAHAHLRGVPWIFEVRDLWPESAVTTGVLRKGAPLTKLLYGLERWACWSADRINVLTPAFRMDIIERRLADDSKIVFVPNGADVSMFKPGPRDNTVRRELGWGDRFVVMYAGAHGRANALGQLIGAAERLRDRQDILIACVGDGPERAGLMAEVARRRLENIRFHGPVPKNKMPDVVNACDVGAAVLQRNPTFRTVYPNKVFDYMACERPILLVVDGVARELVCDQARAGVFAEPEDQEAIAAAILRLADNPTGRAEMGRRGREWVLANATREVLARRYLDVMIELVQRG